MIVSPVNALPKCPLDQDTASWHNCFGEIKNNILHDGKGTVTKDGPWRKVTTYHGEWQDGEYHGNGILNRMDLHILDEYELSSSYTGEWRKGRYHGKGVSISKNNFSLGMKNEGVFEDNQFIKGTQTWFEDFSQNKVSRITQGEFHYVPSKIENGEVVSVAHVVHFGKHTTFHPERSKPKSNKTGEGISLYLDNKIKSEYIGIRKGSRIIGQGKVIHDYIFRKGQGTYQGKIYFYTDGSGAENLCLV